MEYVMSMVHHNPGEPPFKTIFNNAEDVKEYGFNSQVFKHINTIVTFDKLGLDLFPKGSPERKWLDVFSTGLIKEMKDAKRLGLMVYYHIDLFVLPKKIVEIYKDEICDGKGKISLYKPMTLKIHSLMFDEIFTKFPEVDGLIVRTGETYLDDTPYHTGNGAVVYGEKPNYRMQSFGTCDKEPEKKQFVYLLNFLRDEICVKNNKKLFFRTWDCFPDRFHANLDYYLDVTNKIEPHENLYFSVKYVALDFWRRVKFNECLTAGKHKQIIEVQCQREYEGKGAYPSYVMKDVIDGDIHLKNVKGIRDIAYHPHIKGIYAWPRGGGWNGPYLTNEFWCKLNTYVISQYGLNPNRTEEEIFYDFVQKEMNLNENDRKLFREMCLLSNEALLKAHYIEEYDKTLNEELMPCCIWTRDDRLGGMNYLNPAFEVLYKNGTLDKAIAEKKEGLDLWFKVRDICDKIDFSHTPDGEFIKLSVEYACRLFNASYIGWEIMALGFIFEKNGKVDKQKFAVLVAEFNTAWGHYNELKCVKECPSLYRLDYLFNEGGMGETIENYKNKILNRF